MHTYHYDKFVRDPNPVKDMLTGTAFQGLIKKTQRIQSADQLLRGIVPKELAPRCRLINLLFDTAIIEVDTAIYATQVRYLSKEILSSLCYHDFLINIKKIKIKLKTVRPAKQPSRLQQPNTISPKSCDSIRESAQTINHPALKHALLKLANTNLAK